MNSYPAVADARSHGSREPSPLPVSAPQMTLAAPAEVSGVGFVTGADVAMRFLPAGVDEGISFVRVDLPGTPAIHARHSNVVPERRRRTALCENGATVEMTEHALAALAGLGIDNCRIEVNAGETPGMDGSALAFVEAIDRAGILAQSAAKRPLVVESPLCVRDGSAMVAVHPAGADRLEVTFNLEYAEVPTIGRQSFLAPVTPDFFRREIAPARTFVLYREVEELRRQGIGARSTPKDLLVFDNDGRPIENRLRFPDECARHKILDVIGDFALLGRPIHGHILAHKSGHHLNARLMSLMAEESRRTRRRPRSNRVLLDPVQIERFIPHRFPFLLVDRVVDLEPERRVVAIKNVTYNEPFFQGHWPGKPVMPGVLIIEAMAQASGVLLAHWHEKEAKYALLVSLNEIKLRRAVVPGDQLRLEAEAVRLKERSAIVSARALVENELAAEAELRFVIADDEAAD